MHGIFGNTLFTLLTQNDRMTPARTIADLEGEERVRQPHVAEAIQGRLLDREVVR